MPATVAATGNATTFNYAALVAIYYSVPVQYRERAAWIMSDGAARNLVSMVDTNGRPLLDQNATEGEPPRLLGKPIYISPDMPAPAANAKSILFGDFNRAYTVRRVNGFAMQRQNELHSDNGQIGFRGYERVDGRVVLADAVRAGQHSAT